MLKKINKQIIATVLILCFIVSNTSGLAYASGGWKPAYEKTFTGTNTRLVISKPHYGWCCPKTPKPDIYANHINVVIYRNNIETTNWHVFKFKTKTGRQCIRAYDSKSRKTFQFKKCNDNYKDAITELINSANLHSISSDLARQGISFYQMGAILIAAISILVSMMSGLPPIVLA